MKNLISKVCTGCGACYCICPQQCISMVENKKSEKNPVIDNKKCIKCNLCKKICPQLKPLKKYYPIKSFVAWSKNSNDLKYSASGGVAAAIARYQLLRDNRVYGCDYNNYGDLIFFLIKSDDDILKMESSKYSQSEAYSIFPQIKNDLQRNYSVVFIGTPCQVAALKKYLIKNYNNLLTIDLVCHGTPPNSYLKEYLHEIGIEFPIDKIRFRGEYDQILTIWKDGKIIYQRPYETDIYFSSFYKNKISMNACYSCQYAQSKRVSDLTIADFWGLGKLLSITAKSNRPSLILINTEKGQKYYNDVSSLFIFEERTVLEAIDGNGRLNKPPGKSLEAKAFQKLYLFTNFVNAVKISEKIRLIQNLYEKKKKKFMNFNKRIKKSIKRRLRL